MPPDGQRVAPFFDGFYENPDGTITLSFGYSNFNREQTIEIPLGPDNFIEPKEYDGRQPTSFPIVPGSGPAGARRDRERGVFTVTVPATFKGDVVWTLRHAGQTHKVPGRIEDRRLRPALADGERIHPAAAAFHGRRAIRPRPGRHREPAVAGHGRHAVVGDHLDEGRQQAYRRDPRSRSAGPSANAINVNWYKHSGPGPVTFDPPKSSLKELEGTATSAITFAQPGTYMLRVRADNFGRVDTSAGNQCCWTNGYIRVSVK